MAGTEQNRCIQTNRPPPPGPRLSNLSHNLQYDIFKFPLISLGYLLFRIWPLKFLLSTLYRAQPSTNFDGTFSSMLIPGPSLPAQNQISPEVDRRIVVPGVRCIIPEIVVKTELVDSYVLKLPMAEAVAVKN